MPCPAGLPSDAATIRHTRSGLVVGTKLGTLGERDLPHLMTFISNPALARGLGLGGGGLSSLALLQFSTARKLF